MNEDIFQGTEALTFDDVVIVPGFAEVHPNQTQTAVEVVPGVRLQIPILSAAMDKVTEAELAIALAREGGIGIIHRNNLPQDQAAEVDKVKRSQSGMIVDPFSLPPDATVREAEVLMSTYHISGIPITESNGELVGILTNRDVRFLNTLDYDQPLSNFMTRGPLVTGSVGVTLAQAMALLQEHRIEKLPLVDRQGILKGLITVKDIQKQRDFPNAAKDSQGRLLVGAAVGVGPGLKERASQLMAAGVDLVVIDSAHGHSKGVIEAIQVLREEWPKLAIIAGNVVTAEGTQALIEAGANAVKTGVGAGSICTTRVVAGAGLPQLSAIHSCAMAAEASGVPIIADGGITHSGDIVKAIGAGANAVMLGSLLAGLDESPGELILFEGRRFKEVRGMGSLGAMQGHGRDRYASAQGKSEKLVPEGIEGRVPYKGNLSEYVFQLIGGLRSGMGYAGAANLEQLRRKTRFRRVTHAGKVEGHPHDVIITKEAPNYSSDWKPTRGEE